MPMATPARAAILARDVLWKPESLASSSAAARIRARVSRDLAYEARPDRVRGGSAVALFGTAEY